jgi:uncharacterized membrane protein (DUF2068 family)
MRPLGVTFSAYFQFFRGAMMTLAGLGVLFAGGLASRLAAVAAEGNTLQRILSGLGHFLGIALLLYALIHFVLGAGLLLAQNWARFLTIIVSALGVLLMLPKLIHLRPVGGLLAATNLFVLIYLLLPATQAWFENKSLVKTVCT